MPFDSSRDQEHVDDSRSIGKKLLFVGILSGTGGTAFDVNHRIFGTAGFHWLPCMLSAGLIAGAIAGVGAYGAGVGYVSMRTHIRLYEIAIPALFGSLPGLVVYLASVRLYYWLTESDK